MSAGKSGKGWRIEFQIDGLHATLKALQDLEPALQRKILRPAMTKAARVVAKSAKGSLVRETGTLKRAMGTKIKSYPRTNSVIGVVGPRTKKARMVKLRSDRIYRRIRGRIVHIPRDKVKPQYLTMKRNPTKYAHLVERGTKFAPAKPFLSRAVAATRSQVLSIISHEVAAGLAKHAGKP